jgi:16S rRNA processing protein RimM
MQMDHEKSAVLVGKIAGAYGIKGWLKVSSFTEPPENLISYTPWQLRSLTGLLPVEMLQGKPHGKGLVVQLDGIDDRDKAAELKGMEIVVNRDQLPEPESDHYYWADLEGLRVETSDGKLLGSVDHLLAAGASDVMVVSGEQRHLIPFITGEIVLNVDLAGGFIQVNWDADKQGD